MALNQPTTLAFPPVNQPIVDTKSGILTPAWAQWYQQMYVRIGGTTPVNPQVKTQVLLSGYPFNFFLAPGPVNWNGFNYTAGQIVPFYQSSLGVSSLLDSFTVSSKFNGAGSISVYLVPYNNLPTPQFLIVNNQAIGPLAQNLKLQGFTGQELGSGAYLAVVANPSQQLLCTLMGRLLT